MGSIQWVGFDWNTFLLALSMYLNAHIPNDKIFTKKLHNALLNREFLTRFYGRYCYLYSKNFAKTIQMNE